MGVYVAIFAGFGVASPFLPGLLAEHGLSAAQIGFVLGLSAAFRMAAGPAGGWLADRTGAAPLVLAGGMVAAACATLGFGAAYGVLPLALVAIAYASLLAPLTPIADALALSAGRGGGVMAYGWLRGAGSGAFIAGSAIAGQVVGWVGLGIILWMQSALLLVSAAFARRVPRITAGSRGRQAPRSVRPWTLLALPVFGRVMLVAALIGGSHAMHDGFEVIRWRAAGMSPGAAGLLWAESVSAEVLVFLVLGPVLIDRLGIRVAAMISAVSGIVRWSTAACTAGWTAMALVEPLHGFTFALLHLVCMRVIGQVVPARMAATAQTLYGTVIVGAATTAMTFASGPLYGHFGSEGFLVMAALCAVALPICAGLSLPAASASPVTPADAPSPA